MFVFNTGGRNKYQNKQDHVYLFTSYTVHIICHLEEIKQLSHNTTISYHFSLNITNFTLFHYRNIEEHVSDKSPFSLSRRGRVPVMLTTNICERYSPVLFFLYFI